jgi:hypothetical protein
MNISGITKIVLKKAKESISFICIILVMGFLLAPSSQLQFSRGSIFQLAYAQFIILNGPVGPQGIPGRNGTDGRDGEDGSAGPQGIQGIPGEKGEKGDKGETGERGLPGQRGEQGPQGMQGVQGKNGTQGSPGKDAPITKIKARYVDGNPIRVIGEVKSVATCYSNEWVVGGGFSIKKGFGIILESSSEKNSWVATAANPFEISNSTKGTLQAHAVCLKLDSGK